MKIRNIDLQIPLVFEPGHTVGVIALRGTPYSPLDLRSIRFALLPKNGVGASRFRRRSSSPESLSSLDSASPLFVEVAGTTDSPDFLLAFM